jgi:hypothetical protein
VAEQSRREFTSANQVAGADDETVQVTTPSAAFPFSLRNHYLTLPSGATSLQSSAYRAVMKLRFALWEEAIALGPMLN